ncbi:MAG: TonB-dependent receptor [Candidatus Omnitrophica bacterium]|nr:TonB-dependent receptor [Candidatus Omnitrophota bacterium]
MKKTFILLLLCLCPVCGNCETITLEPITVSKTGSKNASESIDNISQEDIRNLPYSSLEELLNYSSSTNLKERSPFGVQQDFSMRGSVFEDANVTLNGVKINDPQTGHYTLEIPLTSADLEEINIYKNSQKVDFKLKAPRDKGVLLKSSFGQYALWENLMSVNFPVLGTKNRLSVEHKISKGSRQDTDFEIYNFSYHSLLNLDNRDLEFLFGSTKRDFGADSFYSSRFRQEEEHVNQRFFLARFGMDEGAFKLNNTAYFRRHGDKFILDRTNPSFSTNIHKTYVYGLKEEFNFRNGLFTNINIEEEKIDSTNLGKHTRQRKGFLAGLNEKQTGKFLYGFSAGTDYYYKWSYLENGHVGLGYLLKDNLKLKFSYDRLWRAPSFTELYYSDAANRGNPNLGIQRSNNFDLGFEFLPKDFLGISSGVFLRDQYDTIDWVRNSPSDVWQAQNVGNVKAYGVDITPELKFKDCILERLSIGYTYLTLNKASPYPLSKYVFDYDRHKIITNFGFNYKGYTANLISNFANPVDRRKYVTFDLKLEKKLRDFTIALEGINIFNKSYEELKDIDGTKRWYKLSLAYEF